MCLRLSLEGTLSVGDRIVAAVGFSRFLARWNLSTAVIICNYIIYRVVTTKSYIGQCVQKRKDNSKEII